MVETEARMAETLSIEDWTQTPWRKLEQYVYRLQKRIYKAQSRGNSKAVHSLQRLLMKSRAARTMAVRRVTQDNQGKRTAGVDGIKSVGPVTRLVMVDKLRHPETKQARPVRRVMIPKPGKDEKRPLGIPTMMDRAHQALVKLALEPQWEARFEPNSYGFRPGRSCHDAIEAIWTMINKQAKYVLDADIKGCFDNINHQALLNKLDSIPAIRRATKAWLKAGVMMDGAFAPTTMGTPQGGVISPLLANIALHGMEEAAARAYQRWVSNRRSCPGLVRYADDFVILYKDLEGVTAARRAIEQFLMTMGLHLSPSKTRITHTLNKHEGYVGFNFLGFHIRQYPIGQARSGRLWNGKKLGFKTYIKPSEEAIKRHTAELNEIVRKMRTASQEMLIYRLNPIIRGWSRYFRTVVASRVFEECDHHLYYSLESWARRRHPNKNKRWRAGRYWDMEPGHKWNFAVRSGEQQGLRLVPHTDTHIQRHVKVKGRASPYDSDLVYWATRLKAHPLTGNTVGKLLALQRGKCPGCGLYLKDDDLLEIDHRIPRAKGGSDTLNNKQVMHRHCHDQKTALD
jgi:RNA-directed DNA polymerase